MASQWLATAYVAAVSLLLVFLVARQLGPDDFGVYSYVLSIAALFAIVLDGGYRTLLFREGVVASEPLRRSGQELLPQALGHLLLALVLGLSLLFILPVDDKPSLLTALACFACITLSGLIGAQLKGAGRFHDDAVWQVVVRTASAVLMVVVVLVWPSVPALFGAWALGTALALTLPLARRLWLHRPTIGLRPVLLRACLAFILIDAATTIYFRSNIILLSHLGGGNAEAGNYAAAYRLLEGVILMAMPAAHIAFRSLRLQWENRSVFRARLVWLLVAMTLSSLSVVAAGFLAGPWLIGSTFGPAYDEAGALLGWLLCSLFFVLPNLMLTQAAIALNQEGKYAVAALAAAVLNIGLNIWLIPPFGALGAAWATLATEGLLMLWLGAGLARSLRPVRGDAALAS